MPTVSSGSLNDVGNLLYDAMQNVFAFFLKLTWCCSFSVGRLEIWGGELPNVFCLFFILMTVLLLMIVLWHSKQKVALLAKWQKLKDLKKKIYMSWDICKNVVYWVLALNIRWNNKDMALLKVTLPKNKEPVASSFDLSQHSIFCTLFILPDQFAVRRMCLFLYICILVL